MKQLLLSCLFTLFSLSACKKDDPKPTDLILGEWAYYRFENTYYTSDDETNPEERAGWYSDIIRLNFDGFQVSRVYTHYEPEAGPYTIFQRDGKYFIEVPHYHDRATFELAKLTKDEMHWIQTRSNVEYVGPNGYKTAKKAYIKIIMKKQS